MEMNNSQLVPFCFGENLVRVIEDENGNPWFVAKDVAKAMEYPENSLNQPNNLFKHIPSEWRGHKPIMVRSENGVMQTREMLFLSEQGLYFFLARSDKPKALPFQKWIAGDVLPTIRKTGRYESRKAIAGAPIPDSVVEISLNLKPAMRQRLWRDALDTARLDGGGIGLACQCFESLCGMMSAKRVFPDTGAMIIRFMDERLIKASGYSTPFAKIEKAFREWWQEFGYGNAPSHKTLANYLRTRFEAYKCSVMMYRDCMITESA